MLRWRAEASFERATLIPFKLQPKQNRAKISLKPGSFDARAKTLKTEECSSVSYCQVYTATQLGLTQIIKQHVKFDGTS